MNGKLLVKNVLKYLTIGINIGKFCCSERWFRNNGPIYRVKLYLGCIWPSKLPIFTIRSDALCGSKVILKVMRIRRTVFWGWQTTLLDQAKGYFNTFHSQISYFVLKISLMSNSWTGQVSSLAHWCGRP